MKKTLIQVNGKRLYREVKQAINNYYGLGHDNTRATHKKRMRHFVWYCTEYENITSIFQLTKNTIVRYAQYIDQRVKSQEISVTYAQNCCSSVNTLYRIVCEVCESPISPSEFVGSRRQVRTTPPTGLDFGAINAIMTEIQAKGYEWIALVIYFARAIGLRFQEACQQNYVRMYKEASTTGEVRVMEGTKGGTGKKTLRYVKINPYTLKQLQRASELQAGHKSLMPPTLSRKQAKSRVRYQWNKWRNKYGLGRFHDLRASFACDRYFEITSCPAPVLRGKRMVEKELDAAARLIISRELGHGRRSVMASYIGSSR
jgi:integrase